jgi:hypothetical protein
MAFVNDPTEEELQRALAAVGGAPTVQSGPGAAPAGGGGAGATAVPASAAPGSAPGGDPQSTGFVNLSRYFDANQAGAEQQARTLTDPLKVDPTPAGTAAANAVPVPTLAPAPQPTSYQNNSNLIVPTGEAAYHASLADAAKRQADLEAALKQREADSKVAAEQAIQGVVSEKLTQGSTLANDPLQRNEALSTDGKNPSAFDSYLTGAGMPDAYRDLRTYYAARTPPVGDPGRPAGPGSPSASMVPGAPPMASTASVLDPQKRKRSNAGGW